MKKASIITTNIFNEEITLNGFILNEDLNKESVRLFEEENDEDFFIINQIQIKQLILN